jgi:REP element-mobilizing transposase RayT
MDHQRRLPHQFPDGADLFLTWHLYGSLPPARYPPAGKMSAGKAFVWMDRYLDTTRDGPMWLQNPAVAEIVEHAMFREVQLQHCRLHACVVMANHVHILITPLLCPSVALQSLKGFSAREANRFPEPYRPCLLASRVVRSLDAQRQRVDASERLHREQSGDRWTRTSGRRLPVVQCMARTNLMWRSLQAAASTSVDVAG